MSPQASYSEVLIQARQRVQTRLDESERIMEGTASGAPGELNRRMLKIMSRKGKRVRSILLFLLSETGHQTPTEHRTAKAAASIEMLHLASLVHDDVIDASQLRRGMVTAHEEWGNKIAVLVGDYILSKSMELVVADEDRRLSAIVSEASSRLVAGEVLELDLAGRLDTTIEQYTEVIEGKTAALIDSCARCGAILAGHNDATVEACGQMGMHFGLAFQIIDDLLDFGVGASNLGKATFSDLSNGLITLPLLLYFGNCTSRERSAMTDLLAQANVPGVPEKIARQLFEKNCFQQAKEIAMDHTSKALGILEELPPSEARDLLIRVCGAMADRSN